MPRTRARRLHTEARIDREATVALAVVDEDHHWFQSHVLFLPFIVEE
jgi:hypothetical protein